MKLHGEEVSVGDPVWHVINGWGEVSALDDKDTNYPILVHWEGRDEWFTEDGKFHTENKTPVLFWQPSELERLKKPKQMEKAWQWVCKTGDEYWLTSAHYTEGEEALEFFPNAEPIEPYLPSEIEREVKE